MTKNVNDPPNHEEIANISARVFRRDQQQSHTPPVINLNEYFARNLNMKLSHDSTKHQINAIRTGSSSLRQMLPIALCLFTFASVLSMLIIYIDTTEIRHQQFRLNMSRDYDLQGISQDNPVLVSYLREVHLKKYVQEPMFNQPSAPSIEATTSPIPLSKLVAEMGEFVTNLLAGKRNGHFIQSSMGASDGLMVAPYLIEKYQWQGMIVEPDPKRYFNYGKTFAQRRNVTVIHACFSPTGYPKEVTLHQENMGIDEDSDAREEVKISSVLDGEEETQADWFESRVKCFPLYTLMLAANQTEIDLLSLSLHGLELQILKTVPFQRVRVNVISLHFAHGEDQRSNYVQTVTRFLTMKGFKLMRVVAGHNYFYKSKTSMKKD